MVSNGLSSRRTTLKRPIVCKSKPTGHCGACEFFVQAQVADCQPLELVDFALNLTCDPDPTDLEFKVTQNSAFIPAEPAPTLLVNVPNDWHLNAPNFLGNFIIHFSITNGDRCIFLYDLPITVRP